MPYRRIGPVVQVQKDGRWQTLKMHPTVKRAIKHLTALRINVPKDR